MNTKELDEKFVAPTYGRFNVELTKGKGSTLYDENGKEYIDFGSGIGVTAFGIADEEWKKAVINQLDKLQHTSNLYYTAPCAELAKLLCEKTGMKKVFFSNSGAEANEGAIKYARKYSFDKYGEGRSTIITLVNSFHGRTITTLAATGQDSFHTNFAPFTPGFKYCPANDIDAIKKMATDDVCAIMFECVQGEGGVLNLEESFVKEIEKLAKEKDILMVVDEVQTGNGRTGKYFAYMNFGIDPDIVSTAKGLAGGLPMGAVLFGEKVESHITAGSHGSTFGGNPVAAAGAVSIVERIDDEFMKTVFEKSEYIMKFLKSVNGVKSISGMGLMLGIETGKDAKEVVNACLEKGLLVLTAKTKIRLLPALNISYEEIDKGLNILKEVIEK
ncbi:acetylornithine aminotransferase [Clostridiales bacterium]|nr:aspartate aminotransferase family protein [Eubacterium sp.]GFI71523.1 acetylornithine aminotransferase [Clostridiales bacterium]